MRLADLKHPIASGESDTLELKKPIRRILTHLGLWRGRKGNERGTAPLEGPESDADLVYEPVDDGWPGYDESP
jgi:hypothetical protein